MNSLVTDAEFFRLIDWDAAAPKTLRQIAKSGDWQRAVRVLTTQASKSSVAPGHQSRKLALWSLHDLQRPQRLSRLIAAWQAFGATRPASRRSSIKSNGRGPQARSVPTDKGRALQELAAATEEWLAAASGQGPVLPLELLIVFEILRDAAAHFPLELAARLWRITLEIAVSQISRNGTHSRAAADRTQDLGQAAVEAELAWQAGLLFSPVAGSTALRDAGRAGLWDLLAQASDESGVPAARTLRILPAWMTSVIRAREWGRRFGQSLFTPSQEKRVRGVVSSIAKICREDGRLALVGGTANGLSDVWSAAAATFPAPLLKASPAAHYLLSIGREKIASRSRRNGAARNGSRRNGSRRNGSAGHKVVRPVFQSDASRLACLRGDWSPTANSLLVSHQGRFPALELALGGTTLFAGDWEIDLRVDGRPVEPAEWTCVCWHSDDDGDYLELQTRPAGVRVERQVFLSRTDDFALLADVISTDGHAKIECSSRLPLAPDCAAIAQTRSRESGLVCGGARVRAFPLGLSCPRFEASAGQLGSVDGRLELTQVGLGGLYAPLVLDWNPRRRRSPVSWRPLTVAQDGAAVRSNGAAAFLLEVGPEKWLIYRSLLPTLEPRSVLGQHTMYETLVGCFVRGDLEPIVQVEQTTESGA
ncbi:MAG TPA: hypothetical protein VGP63_13165 [Planctomycetaceae bacterium]|nr:hypothetical protein [Planctomycetaceae bacterium]